MENKNTKNKICPHCGREFIFVGTTAYKKLNGEFGDSVPIYICTSDREKITTVTDHEKNAFDRMMESFGEYYKKHEREQKGN